MDLEVVVEVKVLGTAVVRLVVMVLPAELVVVTATTVVTTGRRRLMADSRASTLLVYWVGTAEVNQAGGVGFSRAETSRLEASPDTEAAEAAEATLAVSSVQMDVGT